MILKVLTTAWILFYFVCILRLAWSQSGAQTATSEGARRVHETFIKPVAHSNTREENHGNSVQHRSSMEKGFLHCQTFRKILFRYIEYRRSHAWHWAHTGVADYIFALPRSFPIRSAAMSEAFRLAQDKRLLLLGMMNIHLPTILLLTRLPRGTGLWPIAIFWFRVPIRIEAYDPKCIQMFILLVWVQRRSQVIFGKAIHVNSSWRMWRLTPSMSWWERHTIWSPSWLLPGQSLHWKLRNCTW